MNYDEFQALVRGSSSPVVLLEGTRKLPDADRASLVALGAKLARDLPEVRFRTGNAPGSDEAFAEGVCSVDRSRLQLVLPYREHRLRHIAEGTYRIGLDELPRVAEEQAIRETYRASPGYESLLEKRERIPKLKAQSGYLVRDTVKVIGVPESDLRPATVGIFYVNAQAPMTGGTGHTIRVCQTNEVPVVFQEHWMAWLTNQPPSACGR